MVVDLSGRALICVSGEDAQDFLHKQFSNDILNLADNTIQLNAYCTHQGRIIALFRVFKLKNGLKNVYYLSFPNDLKDLVLKRLRMFVLNAQVVFDDASNEFNLLGFLDEKPPKELGQEVKYTNNQTLVLVNKEKDLSELDFQGEQQWLLADIKHNIAEITLATTAVFVPQMLNLDLPEVNGVNFQKGCYPGQEIVARLHYLGKAKRRLIQLSTNNTQINIGDKLTIKKSDSLKESGRVILIAQFKEKVYCLATIEIALQDETIYLENYIMEKVNA